MPMTVAGIGEVRPAGTLRRFAPYWRAMRFPDREGFALTCAAFALGFASPAAAGDLISKNFRLRGLHVATSGSAWLVSTAASPTISGSGVSVGQPEAIGWGLPAAGLETGWPGFWPRIAGEFPTHDFDGDGVPGLVDLDDDADGAPDDVELGAAGGLGTDPLDPDSDDDGLCDGAPSGLPACALGGEDLDGDGVYDVGIETDPTDPDTDDDGWNDGIELVAGTNPLDPDSDDDWLCDGAPSGLPACALGGEDLDGDGVYDVGSETNPNDPDTDHDGFDDQRERAAGSNPLDPQSVPFVTEVPALGLPGSGLLIGALAWIGMAGLRRRIWT